MPDAPDPLAAELAKWQAVTDAATKGPWSITENHGRDIADEAWSDIRITGPAGEQIMLAYLTGILEPGSPSEDADPDFIIAARSYVPALLGMARAVLKLAARWEAFGGDGDAQSECAAELREAISSKLLGEGESDGR
jgi:hypothetical protein